MDSFYLKKKTFLNNFIKNQFFEQFLLNKKILFIVILKNQIFGQFLFNNFFIVLLKKNQNFEQFY